MSDIERLVLEKHQLMAQVNELQNLVVALGVKFKDEKGIVRLTKSDIHGLENYEVEIKALKTGANLIVRNKGV